MANYLNKTVLGYFYDRLKTVFATKTQVDTLEDRVDDIIAEGGEPNVIETVKVNGTTLTPDAQKAVNVPTPSVESDEHNEAIGITGVDDTLEYYGEIKFTSTSNGLNVKKTYNSGNYDNVELTSKTYVDANGGKIDKIKVNGTEQTITNKEVDLTIPAVTVTGSIGENRTASVQTGSGLDVNKLSIMASNTGEVSIQMQNSNGITMIPGLANKNYVDATFRTEAQVDAQIDAKVARVYKPAGSVAFNALPTPAVDKLGYVYDVTTAFTTTADFLEGAGHEYPAGTNVVIVEGHGGSGGTVYMYDVLPGFIDLSNYWDTTNLVAITTAEVDEIIDGVTP